eukprot:10552578-Prorocentrum_lima.AAC.1
MTAQRLPQQRRHAGAHHGFFPRVAPGRQRPDGFAAGALHASFELLLPHRIYQGVHHARRNELVAARGAAEHE